MNKNFLVLFFTVCTFAANAQVFVENFETATVGSNLEEYNDWYVSPAEKDGNQEGVSPVIALGPLTYKGYVGSGIGNVVVLDSSIKRRGSLKSTSLLTPTVGNSIYVAFLVKVNSQNATIKKPIELLTFNANPNAEYSRGRAYAQYFPATNEVAFAVTKFINKSAISTKLNTADTHLLVIKYESVDGKNNDIATLYINPDLSAKESKQKNLIVKEDDTESDVVQDAELGLIIRQNGLGAQIGGIRVGTSWNEIMVAPKGKKKK